MSKAYTDALKAAFAGYGRRNGAAIELNGKNADLDRGGQINVEIVELDDDGYMHADVDCYANICAPEDERKADIATELVCECTEFPGEWSGSDYWTFHVPEFRIRIAAPAVQGTEDDAPLWAQALHDAIRAHASVKQFDERMGKLHDDIEAIE